MVPFHAGNFVRDCVYIGGLQFYFRLRVVVVLFASFLFVPFPVVSCQMLRDNFVSVFSTAWHICFAASFLFISLDVVSLSNGWDKVVSCQLLQIPCFCFLTCPKGNFFEYLALFLSCPKSFEQICSCLSSNAANTFFFFCPAKCLTCLFRCCLVKCSPFFPSFFCLANRFVFSPCFVKCSFPLPPCPRATIEAP